MHDPDAAALRHAASAKGGRKRSNAERAKAALPAGCLSADQLRGILGTTLVRTLNGGVEPGVANAVANVARAYIAATEAATLETLAERLDVLEAAAARLRR